MAKNDYFIVVYRILSYLYECFMTGERPDVSFFGPEALDIRPCLKNKSCTNTKKRVG